MNKRGVDEKLELRELIPVPVTMSVGHDLTQHSLREYSICLADLSAECPWTEICHSFDA